ncbi:virulence factor SrfB [Streptomyces sp. VRA16 Mangrove soil]|uniref:virulence factor SrfB n=1 Tax=Streptomyces sp. VRA16 Mangrove soil TaxID=2817434 RepID=UPI001A9CEA6B|nr:virulence factor SrfB [Streptomyces sp. VRA16 Mangrove soil]MBO1330889.1 virulence factor SrfB [Streptomyces sp. VRA16 Mangrove soil]
MALDVKFLLDASVGGPPARPLRPDASGRYRLPAVRLTPGETAVRIESFTCRAEPDPARPGDGPGPEWLRQVADGWRAVAPAGQRIALPVDVAAWPVSPPDGSPDAPVRLVCDVEYVVVSEVTGREVEDFRLRAHAAVSIAFARPARAMPPPPPPTVPPDTDRYLGHAAIDFGTSNSTVTLYDALIHTSRPFSTSQVQRLRTGILQRVLGAPFPQVVTGEWASVLALTAAELGEPPHPATPGAEAQPLATRIGSETGSTGLFRLCLLLEQRLPDCSYALRHELARRLYRCYDDAFSEPPLEPMRLFQVELGDGSHEVPSRLEVLGVDPLTVRLGDPERLPPPGGDTATLSGVIGQRPLAAYRGLKLRLGDPRPMEGLPGDTPPTSDDLIRTGLGYLVDRADRYIHAHAGGSIGSGTLDDIVLTYPTVATPDVRRTLFSLVADGLGINRVSMHFDEAIAAVMFFVMRDFGGDLNVGVEAFRARSREQRLGTWVQNIAIIDIGGGTTDMALVTLTLKDTTPTAVLERPDADRLGRHYTLIPKVRGSSGHTRLGGDLLTLTVFHWLKASLADRLLARAPEGHRTALQTERTTYLDGDGRYRAGRLPTDVHADDDTLRAAARRLAEAVVPTQWKNGPASEREQRRWHFEQLWKLADQAKIHLGASAAPAGQPPSAMAFGEQELSGILGSLGRGDPSLGPDTERHIAFELDPATFRELIRPHLENVVDLADGMLRQRLRVSSVDEPLDRVVLTGKTSAMPLVREILVDKLGRGWNLDWDPATIEVEHAYAKTATSIGAAWAEHVRQTAFAPEGAIPALEQGRSLVQVDVDNLFFALPCAFEHGLTHGVGDLTLFSANEELHHLVHTEGAAPVLAVRSTRPKRLTESVSVVRVREGNQGNITWGQFKCPQIGRQLPGMPPGAMLDPAVWPDRVDILFEVTADLDVFGHLSYGRPHHIVPEHDGRPTVDVWRTLHKAGHLKDGRHPDVLPLTVYVGRTIAGSAHAGDGTPVFTAGALFDETFHDDTGSGPGRPGLLSAYLPEPAHSGEWEFSVAVEGEQGPDTITLGRLRRPATALGLRTRYRASLDAAGQLRVHAAELPFWPARDLIHVQEEPGRVLRERMTVQDKNRDELDDPFAGVQ